MFSPKHVAPHLTADKQRTTGYNRCWRWRTLKPRPWCVALAFGDTWRGEVGHALCPAVRGSAQQPPPGRPLHAATTHIGRRPHGEARLCKVDAMRGFP